MPTVVLSPEKFREEASRRLIDRFEVQKLLDIRSRASIARMVEDGRLPRPVVSKTGASPLWDKDEVLALTDRKE
jgi:predicted DNA-binding transcriptional regulator AlpA